MRVVKDLDSALLAFCLPVPHSTRFNNNILCLSPHAMPGPRPFKNRSGSNYNSRGRGSSARFRGRGNFGSTAKVGSSSVTRTADGLVLDQSGDREGTDQQEKWNEAVQNHELDESLGFHRFEQGAPRVGWLINIQPVRALPAQSSRILPLSHT